MAARKLRGGARPSRGREGGLLKACRRLLWAAGRCARRWVGRCRTSWSEQAEAALRQLGHERDGILRVEPKRAGAGPTGQKADGRLSRRRPGFRGDAQTLHGPWGRAWAGPVRPGRSLSASEASTSYTQRPGDAHRPARPIDQMSLPREDAGFQIRDLALAVEFQMVKIHLSLC